MEENSNQEKEETGKKFDRYTKLKSIYINCCDN